jgi:hypothetical protein
VDGEYEIQVEMQRGSNDEILGTGRERQADLRLDGQRLQLFTLPARGREADINTGVRKGTEPEANLKVRLPVKAGTHTIAAALQKDTVLQEGIIVKERADVVRAHFEGVGAISITGRYNVQGQGKR